MQVRCLHPSKLAQADIADWRLIQNSQPELSSPYLTPEWARLVGERRKDARVVIYRKDDRAIGFLPLLRPNDVAALPIGGPICDYQALIGPVDTSFDLARAAAALNVGRIDFTCGLKRSAFGMHIQTRDVGRFAQFPAGWEAYSADREEAGSAVVPHAQKQLRRLKRHYSGEASIEVLSTDETAFHQLIYWKREQLAHSGVTDIFEYPWINGVVRDSFRLPVTSAFGCAMFLLKVEDRPVAGLYCLQSRHCLHLWFAAYDPHFEKYSPATILFCETIKWASEAGYQEFDFGPGDYRFTQSFANAVREVGAGFVGRPCLHSTLRSAQFQARALVEMLPVGPLRHWPGRAMQRFDVARGLGANLHQSPDRVA